MRALTFKAAGGNEVVSLVERPAPAPGGDQVLVGVRYAGLNPADVMQRAGGYPSPPGAPSDIAGIEVAGEVLACGAGVHRFSPGDRVFGLVGGGGLADRVLAHQDLLVAVPARLGDEAAAVVPESFVTAHDALFTQGALRSGDTLLVHGGTGGVGSAAIGLGLAAGARVLSSARSAAGREFVRGLGAEDLDDAAFVAEVRARTGGAGVDVILELVGAPHFPGNLDILARGARIVAVGHGAGEEIAFPLGKLMRARARLVGTVLRVRSLGDKAAAVTAFAGGVVPHLASGKLVPLVDRVFPVEDYAAAFDRMAAAGKRGNILLDFGPVRDTADRPVSERE